MCTLPYAHQFALQLYALMWHGSHYILSSPFSIVFLSALLSSSIYYGHNSWVVYVHTCSFRIRFAESYTGQLAKQRDSNNYIKILFVRDVRISIIEEWNILFCFSGPVHFVTMGCSQLLCVLYELHFFSRFSPPLNNASVW